MPHYDESFIHDDNLNQRRNKRSYRVYKQGIGPISILEPTDVLHALEERGTSVIKRNIRNIKHRGARIKPETIQPAANSKLYQKNGCKSPDIIIDHCPPSDIELTKYYDLRNNNVNLLSPCKSLDNLVLKQSNSYDNGRGKIRNGKSLQNLLEEETLKHYTSVEEVYGVPQRFDSHTRKSYSVADPNRGVIDRRPSLTPGPGIYRQISGESDTANKSKGIII